MTLYHHGSVTDKIRTFRPFSHFGGLDQGLSVIAKKTQDWESGNRKLTGDAEPVPTVYAVEIDPAALARPLAVEDWGTPMVIGIAKAARDAFDTDGASPCVDGYQAFEDIRASLVAEKNSWRGKSDEERVRAGEALQAHGWRLIAAELLKRGWTCLTYSNIVEGPKPARSICVPNPQLVRYVRHWTPSAQELATAKRQT